ncbi:hypothetical protein ACIO1C_22455 [Streptomyces sp. NPDC087420]|uniref:hypothetical protein n=1 Tax=Streptomyces sp. NPDC087420 TaxID=3365785 RepID=UPI0038368753
MHNGGDTAPLLAAIDARLDQLGLPPRAWSGPLEPLNAADGVLHRAGFVSEVTHRGRFHHLPAGMTDPVEQRHAVTTAVDILQVEGFSFSCEADLLDPSLPVRSDHQVRLGDGLSSLTRSIAQAGHTSEAVAALSELTAPGDGVLDRLTEALDETANWWDGLDSPTDPVCAAKLRRINGQLGVVVLEIRRLRDNLADRHTHHPQHGQSGPTAAREPRVAAALAFSPTARRTTPPPPSPSPAATAAVPKSRPSTAPGR